MAQAEYRLRKLGLAASRPPRSFLPESPKPPAQFSRAFVQDDHIPFMARGVDVLHIIPTPFPPTWHTMNDDGDHLDAATVDDWAKIVTAFAAEWLDLDGFLGARAARENASEPVRRRTEL